MLKILNVQCKPWLLPKKHINPKQYWYLEKEKVLPDKANEKI
jgi:hypothetical protein